MIRTFKFTNKFTGDIYIATGEDVHAARLSLYWPKEFAGYDAEEIADKYHMEIYVQCGTAQFWQPMRPSDSQTPYEWSYFVAHRMLAEHVLASGRPDRYRIAPVPRVS